MWKFKIFDMAKKVILKDHDNVEILPITRGELILDSSGNEAFRSKDFLANENQPGLLSSENKITIDNIESGNVDGIINDSGWILTKTDGNIKWQKLPTSVFETELGFDNTKVNLQEGWQSNGFLINETNGFSTGVYILQIRSGSLLFSGIASIYIGEITTDDEIMLHMCGIPHQYEDGVQGRIYAKIAPSETQDCGELYLATNVPQSNVTNLSITMRKII